MVKNTAPRVGDGKHCLILGLDIGIGSCGWSIIDREQQTIIGMGVRLWKPPQEEKTKTSLAATRRQARSSRRNIKRTKDRKKACLELLKEKGLVPAEVDAQWLQTKVGDKPTIKLRKHGLTRKLSSREWAQVLYSLCCRRGYIPHGEGSDDSDGKKVLSAINQQQEQLGSGQFKTVGELLASKDRCRNRSGDYSLCVSNEQIQNEIKLLFNSQKELGNEYTSPNFMEEYLECLTWQKSVLDHDQAVYQQVGYCSYFPDEKRAADSCLSVEMCKSFEKLCHIVYVSPDGTENKLPFDMKRKAIDIWFSPVAPKDNNKECKVTFAHIRTWLKNELGESDDIYFKGVERDEENKLEPFKPAHWRSQRKSLPQNLLTRMRNDREFADEIDSALTFASSKDSLKEQLNGLELSESEIEALCALNFTSRLYSGYGMRSLKAIHLLLDAFNDESITTLAEAEKASGLFYCRQSELSEKSHSLPSYIVFDKTCNNPVVLRVMGQVRKVVNACVAEYGLLDEIHIELARELKHSKKEKDAIAKTNRKNKQARDILRSKIAEELSCDEESVPAKLIMKAELWEEQDGMDLYTNTPIHYDQLLSDKEYCQIDHILPYSRSCDDSRMNKILVLNKSNQDKRNRTPFEWMSEEGTWDSFKTRITRMAHYPQKKKQRLLNTDLSEKQTEFINRNLNDTRYASVAAKNYIERYLRFADGNSKQSVIAVAGGATAALRNAWGIRKDRGEDDLHHAVDAAIIAACDKSTVIAIAEVSERRNLVSKDKRKEQFKRTEPWAGFSDEMLARKERIIPTFMTDHKVSGRLFEDTIYRFEGYNETGTKGILTAKKDGVTTSKPSRNYLVRADGSAVKPDGLAFLRLWWDSEAKVRGRKEPGCYLPEPVYLSDLPRAFSEDYIPLVAPPQTDKKPREKWDPLPEELRQQNPIVLFRNDAIVIGDEIRRFAGFDIAVCSWKLVDPQGRLSSAEATKGLSISTIGPDTRFYIVREDPLGKCFAPFLEDNR